MARKQTRTADSLPLVAIEMGSDSVRALAARRIAPDLFQVLGVEERPQKMGNVCVEQGIITQSSNAGYVIAEVLKLLANRIGEEELPTAFVSVGGQSMQIVAVHSRRDQVRKKEISQALLDEMEQECKEKIELRNPEVAVLGLVPSFFKLDGVEQDDIPSPEQRAALVEAHYIAFYGRKAIDQQLQKSFSQAGRSIEHAFVRPECLLSAFATCDGNHVLMNGCAVIDFGAQTTSLTAYKGGQYLINKVVPKGGYHITRMLEQQGMSFATAEVLKKKFGCASPDLITKPVRLRVPASPEIGGDMIIASNELAAAIELKLQEILAPLLEELKKVEARVPTLYITGGGSMLQGMAEYIQSQTSLNVQYGAHNLLLHRDTDDKYLSPQYTSLVGTILLGQDYRDSHKNQLVRKPGFFDRVKESTLDMFIDQE
ncbi:MAG: rod shape-determining protein [Paludibacteraceae bacterium]|nr:rod shape-determining protein [Paludibacteraceae bacterium]